MGKTNKQTKKTVFPNKVKHSLNLFKLEKHMAQ